MRQDQAKYIKTRLNTAIWQHRREISYSEERRHEPNNIKVARRLIRRWEDMVHRKSDQRSKKIERDADNVRKALLFGEPKAALKALEAFEQKKYGKVR